MINLLTDAINNRMKISFTYSGITRIGSPAALGTSRQGNEVLRIYQTEGGHVNPNHEWDLCLVSEISSAVTTGEVFNIDPPGYKKGDKGMSSIYTEL
jgi:hypothetical protein